MILYLDTSALVKRYFSEPHSGALISKWKDADEIVTSAIAYAEATAAFYRKMREGNLNEKILLKTLTAFREDWKSFFRIQVTEELNEIIDGIAGNHSLRGFDAIHLASAIWMRRILPESIVFACYDSRLFEAAQKESFETFPTVFPTIENAPKNA